MRKATLLTRMCCSPLFAIAVGAIISACGIFVVSCGGATSQQYIQSQNLAAELSRKSAEFQDISTFLHNNSAAFTNAEWHAVNTSLVSLSDVFSLARQFSEHKDSPELLRSLNRAVHIAATEYQYAYAVLAPNLGAAPMATQQAATALDAELRQLYERFEAVPLTASVDTANQTIVTAITVAQQAALLYKTAQGF